MTRGRTVSGALLITLVGGSLGYIVGLRTQPRPTIETEAAFLERVPVGETPESALSPGAQRLEKLLRAERDPAAAFERLEREIGPGRRRLLHQSTTRCFRLGHCKTQTQRSLRLNESSLDRSGLPCMR